ncbi:DoxX family protein [Acidithiobacillus sp. IBUN Pt1247-S3]|uniref:DoxX family protein n=1 Tax=Acidithiobacillus sp. IBUN Pt1247-S3 TaxID=3166642 RepID=UPI0034E574B1
MQNAAVFLARIIIFAWFLPAGLSKITNYTGTAHYMVANGVPGWLLPLVILTEVGGSIVILLGWNTRVFAFLLAGYIFLAVLFFHLEPTTAMGKIVQMAELVDAGGMLVLFAHGAGDWSLDYLLASRKPVK